MSHSDLIYSNRLVVACLIKYQVIIKSIFELSWLYIRYTNMCVQEDTGSTGCKAGGQCQEGEERGGEERGGRAGIQAPALWRQWGRELE